MIWLCIYLWVCTAAAAITGISIIRPVHRGDIWTALTFPIVFPFYLARELTRKAP